MKEKVSVVLLTGGSSGIGAATALLLAKNGMKVYAASRSGKAPSHERIVPLCLDINDEQATIDAVAKIVEDERTIDALICCAGNGFAGPVENTSDAQSRYQFETCFFGTMKSIRSALPVMRKQGRGRIIVVNSVAGAIPLPYQAYYSGAKAALLSVIDALSLEVAPFGIQCCSILPGDAKTGFTSARRRVTDVDPSYTEAYLRSVGKMERDEQEGMTPEVLAKAILRQLSRRRMRPRSTPRLDYKAIHLLSGILPRRLLLWIVGLLYG